MRRILSLVAEVAMALTVAGVLLLATLHWATPCAPGHLC